MSLLSFLDHIRASVVKDLRSRGDDPEKLYSPKTMRNSRDKAAADLTVRIMGVESADTHEAWLTVWSRDRSEVRPVEDVLRHSPEWEDVSDRDRGQRLFRERDAPRVLGFGDDGTATMICTDRGRSGPFTNGEYVANIGIMLDEIRGLLAQAAARAPAPAGALAGAAAAGAAGAAAAPAPQAPGTAPASGGAPPSADAVIGRLIVEREYITREQFEEAVEAHKAIRAMGIDQSLVQVLVGKHLLTLDQAQELRNAAAVETGEARLVAGYEVISKLGQGGMGAVYKARRLEDGQAVALKILPPSLADRETIARFQRESEIVKDLEHDNIVGFVEFGFDERKKCWFSAMELVEGEDLDRRIRRFRCLTEEEAVSVCYQIAQALQHAHYKGLVHRDVKPENIMIAPDGTAKLLDLGLARPASMEITRVTQSGVFVGTPYYVSPEQASGDKSIDIRADIYSLGATLYHAVTGKPPFGGTSVLQVLQRHIREKLPWPADVNPELSDGVCRVITKMMAKERADRYQDPKELLYDLDMLVEGREPAVDDAVLRRSSVALAAVPRKREPPPAPRVRLPKRRERAHARAPADRRGRRRGEEEPLRERDSVRRRGRPGSRGGKREVAPPRQAIPPATLALIIVAAVAAVLVLLIAALSM